ncbi:MAG: DnaB-like helicase C-terminal domain-containing protein, partial [Candidatus Dormibacteria bacterium]
LNWSGSIEQIADLICLIYRRAYYDARSSDPADRARADRDPYGLELSVHKNRSGPTVTLTAHCDVACNAIRDVEEERAA